jgi:hypothetical protein
MIPNENQSPNVTNNNNSKEFPFFFFQIWWFFQKKIGNIVQNIPIFIFIFIFIFLEKKSPKKSYSSRNGLKQTQNHCEITSRLLITHNLLVCHIVILHNSHSSKFITCHSKNGSYQSTIHSFIQLLGLETTPGGKLLVNVG